MQRFDHVEIDAQPKNGSFLVFGVYEVGTGPEPEVKSETGSYRSLVYSTPAADPHEAILRYLSSLQSFFPSGEDELDEMAEEDDFPEDDPPPRSRTSKD